jgi:hypothetical protein
MRVATMLCAVLLCGSSTLVAQAQTGLQEFAPPLSGMPDAQEKSAARATAQKAMVKAMQRGRLKAANHELRKLIYFEALARQRRRADLAKRLQVRIREQRATIRSISNAM